MANLFWQENEPKSLRKIISIAGLREVLPSTPFRLPPVTERQAKTNKNIHQKNVKFKVYGKKIYLWKTIGGLATEFVK